MCRGRGFAFVSSRCLLAERSNFHLIFRIYRIVFSLSPVNNTLFPVTNDNFNISLKILYLLPLRILVFFFAEIIGVSMDD